MAFIRRLFSKSPRPKGPSESPVGMSTEATAKQMAGLSLEGADAQAIEVATFALSWFWFPEAQFGSAPGVLKTRVGFTGGKKKGPTYYNLWVEL